MSIWPDWASYLFPHLHVKRQARLRNAVAPRRARLAFESLENRRLLTVSSNFLTGTLTINLTATDDVALSTAGGMVKLAINGIGGFDPDSGSLFAGDVTNLQITGTGNFANTIDLTGVNKSDFSFLANVALDGGGGSDTYKLDQSILPAAAVVNVADTGLAASGTDTLQLTSTNAGPETIGISQTSVIRSTGPAVAYGAMESLQVSATGSADTINVTSTGASTFTVVNAGGGMDSSGAIDLTQIGTAGLIVNAGSNGESLTLGTTTAGTITLANNLVQRTGNGPVGFSGVSTLNVNGSSGADSFQVNSTAAGTITLDGQGGGDIYSVVQSALGGAININDSGASGTDQVTSTSQAAAGESIGVTNSQITRSGSQAINYTGIENLSVSGTVGGDTFTMTTTPTGATTLDGMAGGDTYNITQSALGGTLSISDTGAAGTDVLTSTSLAAGGESIGVTNSQITRSGSQTISYSGIENLNVNGTAGSDTYTVSTTPGGTTTLDGRAGGDVYNVTQSMLGGPLSVGDSGASGVDLLTSISTTGSGETIGITSAQVTRSGAPAMAFDGIESLTVNGSTGADIFNLVSTSAATSTLIQAGAGNDTINVGSSGNTLANIAGPVSLDGSGNNATPTNSSNVGALGVVLTTTTPVGDTVIFRDFSGATGSTYTLDADKFQRTGTALIQYSGMETVELSLPSSIEGLNILGTAAGAKTTIDDTLLTGSVSVTTTGSNSILLFTNLRGDNDVTIADTGAGSVVRLNTFDGNDVVALLHSGASSGVSIQTGAGVDQITATTTGGGSVLNIGGADGADRFDLAGTGSGSSTSIAGGNDADLFIVGGLSNTLSNVLGDVSLIGDAGSAGNHTVSTTINGTLYTQTFAVGDTVIFNDQGSSADATYEIDPSGLQRTGTGTIDVSVIETLTLNVGSGANLIHISGSPQSFLTINGNANRDTLQVDNFALALVANLFGGDDRFDTDDFSISGKWLQVFGGDGNDVMTMKPTSTNLVVELDGGAGNDRLSIGDVSLVSKVLLSGGPDNDELEIDAAEGGANAQLDGGEGNDNITLGNGAANAIIGHLVAVGGAGLDTFAPLHLTDIGTTGSVIIDGGGDGESLTLNTTTAGTVAVSSTMVQRSGNGPVSYSGLATLVLNGTAGADTFNVTSTPGATTILDGLAGGDTYNVIQSALGGLLTISDTGPSGTDFLSTTSLAAGGENIGITNSQLARSGSQTVGYSGIENLTVNGTAGSDSFTVTTTPAGLTTLDGLGSDDSYLVAQNSLGGALAISDSAATGGDQLTSNSTGSGETIGITSSQITRTSTQTITYSGIETLNVNGTASVDTFNVTTTPSGTTTLDGLAAGDTYNITQSALGGLLTISDSGASGTDFLSSVSFAAGGESIGITSAQITRSGSQTIAYAGIENLTVTGTAGADTFTVTTTPTGITSLDGQNSGDIYNVTQSALGGLLTIGDTGATGTDRVTSSTASAVAETIGVSSSQVIRSGSQTMNYSGIENLTVNGTALADTINITSTATATVTTVSADPLLTDIGTDIFAPIDLTTIGAAGLTISAGADGEALVLNTTTAGAVTISNSTVQRTGNGPISYQGIANLTVNGTGGVDAFQINSTFAATSTIVNAGGGNDTFTLGNAGSLAGFLGVLAIHGETNDASPTTSLTNGIATNALPAGDTLRFDDSATAAATNYALNPTTFTCTGIATVTFDGTETIVLNAGTSGDTIGVSNTQAQVNVTVNSNGGGDTINLANNGNGSSVTLNGGADGDTLNIRAVATGSVVLANGGAGNDTVNVSSNAPAILGTLDGILGAVGIDTGGDSDKIVLSDQAQAVLANTNVVVRSDRVDGFAGPTNAVSIHYVFSGSLEMTLIGSQTLADKFHVALSSYPSPTPLTLKFDGLGQPGGEMDGLRIDGTTGKDIIKVGTFGSANPVQIQNIECLQLFGGTGDDTLQNDTAVSSLIDGGDGNDLLVGGSAVDVIFGGDGVDTLYGRGGNDFLFADYEFNNRKPQVKKAVNGDTVYGDKGLVAGDPFASNPGVDKIVLGGTDNVDAGGNVGDTIVGNVKSLSVLDWLKARFLTGSSKNVQDVLNEALKQPCTMIF